MTTELVMSVGPGELRAGLFVDDRPVELFLERDQRETLVGAVFLGRVLRVLPALPGAFVDLGTSRPAFLPGRVRLTEGASLTVQVVKDPFGDKAAEISTAIELPGRHLTWSPQRPGVAVARHLPQARRTALSAVLATLVRDGEGVAARGDFGDVDVELLREEVCSLRSLNQQIRRSALTARAPVRLDPAPEPIDLVLAAVAGSLDRVLIDDLAALPRARRSRAAPVIEHVAPESDPIRALDDAFADALMPHCALPEGGRLHIAGGFAFTAVDVDLGAAAAGRLASADIIRRVNLAAAERLAQEVRLRNIGGAIVVDFISMSERKHRQDVEAVLAAAVLADPAGVELHGWTRLGHFELTRRRVRPGLADQMLEPAGDRTAKTAATVGLELLRAFARQPYRPAGVVARAHPSVADAICGSLQRHLSAAEDRNGQRLDIVREPGRPVESFDIGPA